MDRFREVRVLLCFRSKTDQSGGTELEKSKYNRKVQWPCHYSTMGLHRQGCRGKGRLM